MGTLEKLKSTREYLSTGVLYDAFMPLSYDLSLKEAWLELNAGNQDVILDAGSGTGRIIVHAKSNLESYKSFILLDIREKALSHSKARVEKMKLDNSVNYINADLTNLSEIENSSIDSALCLYTIYVIKGEKDREKAVSELHRILKTRGQIVFTTPSETYSASNIIAHDRQVNSSRSQFIKFYNELILYPTLKKWLGNIEVNIKNGTYKGYSKVDFLALLEKTGFTNIKVKKTYGKNAFHYICQK